MLFAHWLKSLCRRHVDSRRTSLRRPGRRSPGRGTGVPAAVETLEDRTLLNAAMIGPISDTPTETDGPSSGDGATALRESAGGLKDQYIVALRPDVDVASFADELRSQGRDVLHTYSSAFHGLAVRGSELGNDPRIAAIEPDRLLGLSGQTVPTGIDRIEADANGTANIDGSDDRVDVDIAVLDTGIDRDHPDLNVHHAVDCTRGPDCDRGGDGDDGNGHGTHVAGTAAALDNDTGVVGVAPGARLWGVKVLRDDGTGFLSDVIQGIDYVTANSGEIDVANMSLGAQGQSDSMRAAVQDSVAAGVFYAVSAGNSAEDVYGADGKFGTDDDFFPAAYPEVAAISALSDTDGAPGGNGPLSSWGGEDRNGDGVDDGEDDSFAFFSNLSRTVVEGNPVTSPGKAIDLLMPGVDIHSTWMDGGYNTISGTSMASPHAAGLAALSIAADGRDRDGDGDHDAEDVHSIRQALIDGGVAQDGSNGLVILNDPDSNEENIGWAQDTVGDAPTVRWVNPADGEEVSGSVTIQIDAGDTEDGTGALDVDWRVDGGTWIDTTYSSDSGYYEASWDTTGVSDGSHTLDSRVTDSDGNTGTATVTVTTENTDDAPVVEWVNPTDGETVEGTVTIQIHADDDRDSGSDLTVEWQINDGTWQTATYNTDTGYYEDSWDTTAVDDGDYILDTRATDTGNNSSPEASITATVNNSGSSSDMYVWEITWSESGPHLNLGIDVNQDSDGDGTAENSDDPAASATTSLLLTHDTDGDGAFEPGGDDDSWTFEGDTGSDGQVAFKHKFASNGDYQAEVTDLAHATLAWNPELDADNPDEYLGFPGGSDSLSLSSDGLAAILALDTTVVAAEAVPDPGSVGSPAEPAPLSAAVPESSNSNVVRAALEAPPVTFDHAGADASEPRLATDLVAIPTPHGDAVVSAPAPESPEVMDRDRSVADTGEEHDPAEAVARYDESRADQRVALDTLFGPRLRDELVGELMGL